MPKTYWRRKKKKVRTTFKGTSKPRFKNEPAKRTQKRRTSKAIVKWQSPIKSFGPSGFKTDYPTTDSPWSKSNPWHWDLKAGEKRKPATWQSIKDEFNFMGDIWRNPYTQMGLTAGGSLPYVGRLIRGTQIGGNILDTAIHGDRQAWLNMGSELLMQNAGKMYNKAANKGIQYISGRLRPLLQNTKIFSKNVRPDVSGLIKNFGEGNSVTGKWSNSVLQKMQDMDKWKMPGGPTNSLLGPTQRFPTTGPMKMDATTRAIIQATGLAQANADIAAIAASQAGRVNHMGQPY